MHSIAFDRNSDKPRAPPISSPPLQHFPDSRENASAYCESDDDASVNYSFYSTWSTNYTMSNLPGAGRILGNLYSRAGASLERNVGRLAYRSGIGKYVKAERELTELWDAVDSRGMPDEELNARLCETLLKYARSEHPSIQSMAFHMIVRCIVHWLPLREVFEVCCHALGEPLEAAMFSWRLPNVEYSDSWLYLYRLASLCLSPNLVSDFMARSHLNNSLHNFSQLEGILASCRDSSISDAALALEYIDWAWNYEGLVTYLIRRGYQDGVLIKFATAIRTRYEVTDPGTPEFNLWDRWDNSFDWMVRELIAGFWLSLTALGHREISSLANKFDQMPLWPELYIICRAAQSVVWKKSIPWRLRSYSSDWRVECRRRLPDPKYAPLCEKLMQLEDIHGEAVRKRFPPTFQVTKHICIYRDTGGLDKTKKSKK